MSNIRLDIGSRLRDGRILARQEYVRLDEKKRGYLRAGNSGIVLPGSGKSVQVAGSCHRIAHLRQLGIELDPPDDPTVIMFQVGTANEDIVYADLRQTCAVDEVILREEEIPIEWFTSNQTRVTGRPDMVICRDEMVAVEGDGVTAYMNRRVPILGLELKSIASIWTTRSVLIKREPKLAHLVQAGHYSWQLGVPFRLIYKQYAVQHPPAPTSYYDIRNDFPRPGEPGSEYCEYDSGGSLKSVRPYEIIYSLQFNEAGVLQMQSGEGGSNWVDTIVTRDGIREYYELVSNMPSAGPGPLPSNLTWNGERMGYSACKYCPLRTVCSNRKQDYAQWLSAVQNRLASGNEEE